MAALKQRAYNYGYDPMNGSRRQRKGKDIRHGQASSNFSETGYHYDLNGISIATFRVRGVYPYGWVAQAIDVLSYDYGTSGGNQL